MFVLITHPLHTQFLVYLHGKIMYFVPFVIFLCTWSIYHLLLYTGVPSMLLLLQKRQGIRTHVRRKKVYNNAHEINMNKLHHTNKKITPFPPSLLFCIEITIRTYTSRHIQKKKNHNKRLKIKFNLCCLRRRRCI